MRKLFPAYIVAFTALVFGSFIEASAQCSQWNTSPFPPVVCTNGPLITLTGGSPGPGVYVGPGVIGTGPYQFSAISAGPGSHTLGYKAASCSDTAFIVVNVSNPPTVTLSALGPFCENQDSVALIGGLPTAGGTGYYFGPGVNGTSGNFGPTVGSGGSPYNISYTFTDGTSGCADTATVSVDVNSVTLASLSGLDTAYCVNVVPQTYLVTTVPAIGGTLAGPGIAGNIFNVGNAGVGNHDIKYWFTNTNNCTDTAIAPVHVRALPVVSLNIPGSQKFVCEFDATFGISGQLPTSPGWPSSWFKGPGVDSLLGTFTPATNLVGWNEITFNYFDGSCSNSAIDSILVNPNPIVTLNAFPSPCANDPAFQLNQGSPTNLSATYTGPGVTGGSGIYFFDPAITGAGTFTITYCYTAANSCETCVSQNIVVNPIPAVLFQDPGPPAAQVICENSGGINLNTPVYVSPTGGYFVGPGIDFDSVTFKPSVLGPGSWSVVYHYEDPLTGCSNTSTELLNVNPTPNVVLSYSPMATAPILDSFNIEIKICWGDSAMINYTATPTVNAITPFPGISYWYDIGTTDHYFFPDSTFTYSIVAPANNGCIDTGSVKVVVIQPAAAEIIGDTSICLGDTTKLLATGATSYQWINPSTTADSIMVSPFIDTEYEVVATSDSDGDGKSCSSDTTSTMVVVNPLPLINTAIDTSIFLGDAMELRAYGGESYIWTAVNEDELSCLDCNVPVATPIYNRNAQTIRVYTVIGADSNGCENSDSINVTLNPRIIIFVPTAFSPNGDGFNDELKVETKGIEFIDFEIYDRFGRTIFETKSLDGAWDGTFEGELLGKDVFLFRLTARSFESSIPIEQAGQITLIR